MIWGDHMQDELAAVARELMTVVEPGFDFLTLRATCYRNGSNHRLTSGPSDQDTRSFHAVEKLGAIGPDRPVVFEMRVNADGTFHALVTEKIIQIASYLPPTYTVVLKPRESPSRREVSSLAEVEAAIGVSLPAEVHELYASGAEIDDVYLYPPDEILQTWQMYIAIEQEDPRDWAQPVLYVGPPDAVRTVQFHPLWVPIGANDWGDTLCVDLAPGPGGRVGQVIQMAGEMPLTYLADSVTNLVMPEESAGSEGLEDHFDVPARGPDGVAALPETIQELTLREPGDLDFGLLARLTALRKLHVLGGTSVRLGDLAHLPLERLEVSGDEIQLPACKTLTSLVAGGGARVELPTLPNLQVLDVSDAVVDVESLPQVEYLVLNSEQWRRCSMTPAAATLTGESSLARALDWASERGVELSRQVFSGSA